MARKLYTKEEAAERKRAYQKRRRLDPKNKEKLRASARAYYLRTRDRDRQRQTGYNRDKNILFRHGITMKQKREMFSAQGNRCKCCWSSIPCKKGWVVDHCHRTGEIRGILCGRCNVSLGILGDTLDEVEESYTRFRDYLEGRSL